MPDVLLLKDYKSGKAGEIVSLSDSALADARNEGAVRKVYDEPVTGSSKKSAKAE